MVPLELRQQGGDETGASEPQRQHHDVGRAAVRLAEPIEEEFGQPYGRHGGSRRRDCERGHDEQRTGRGT